MECRGRERLGGTYGRTEINWSVGWREFYAWGRRETNWDVVVERD